MELEITPHLLWWVGTRSGLISLNFLVRFQDHRLVLKLGTEYGTVILDGELSVLFSVQHILSNRCGIRDEYPAHIGHNHLSSPSCHTQQKGEHFLHGAGMATRTALATESRHRRGSGHCDLPTDRQEQDGYLVRFQACSFSTLWWLVPSRLRT
jgi:hypothetical protein